jgi:DNA-directed RNA polymerase specialized sigma24 family protein
VDSPSPLDGSSDFQKELLALRQDPQVRRLAWKLVGDLDLVEDLNQTVCYRLAALKHPERIENIRAYYLRVLRNEATKLYALRQETPFEDPDSDPDSAPAPAQPIDEKVCNALRDQAWPQRLVARRESLLLAIPARSGDPRRYRTVIYHSAKRVLLDSLNGEASDADSNDAFRTAFPEYFAQLRASANLLHQRFRRAREDVKALLQAVVDRDELI